MRAYHLLSDHDNSLDGESSAASVKEVFERRSQKIDDEYVMKAFLAEVVDVGNTGYQTCQYRVQANSRPCVAQHLVVR